MVIVVSHDGSSAFRVIRTAMAVAVLVGAVWLHGRFDERGRGRLALALAIVALPVGLGFMPYVVKGGSPLLALAALVLVVAGLVLLVVGVVSAFRGRPAWERAGGIAATVMATTLVCWVVSPAVMATNVPRPAVDVDPSSRGLAFESIDLVAGDGVHLAGWYVPSRNGAAVVLRHGAGSTRSDVVGHAAVLARHGFGVLMTDARGHGESGGRAMDFGWQGDTEIQAATQFLSGRAEVDPGRIGLVGLSMGGEEAIGASATDARVRAVVAEGATARTAVDDTWLSDQYGVRGAFQEWLERAQDVVTDVLTEASVPVGLRDAAASSRDVRYLLVAAGEVADEAHAAEHIRGGAPERVAVWVVPGADHADGLGAEPDLWEERVTTFLIDTLLDTPGVGPGTAFEKPLGGG